MSEWKEYRLGDLGTVITGKTPSAHNPEDWGDNMLFITPSDYRNYRKYATNSERKLSKVGMDRLEKKILPANSILVTCIGSDMGKVVINGEQCVTNQQINAIVPNTSVNNDFLYYRLISIYDTLRMYGGDGTAVPLVNKNDFENIKIEIPQLDEQKRIASILTSLDDKIDLLNRENATLEAMAETLFRQWFIEEAKEDWEEGKLGDLMEVKYGKDHKKLNDGTIPVFGSGGIMRYAESALYYKESVLIPRKGSLNNVMYIDEPFWTVDTMFYTEMHRPNIAKFIFHFMKGQDLENMNVGSAVPSMTTEVLNNIPLDIPPQELFDKFEETVSVLYLKQKQNRFQIYNLSKQQDVLLPKLMSNKINI